MYIWQLVADSATLRRHARPQLIQSPTYLMNFFLSLYSFAAQVQTARVQDAEPGRAPAEGAAHPGQPAALPGVHQRGPGGEGGQDVRQGPRPELPLPGDGRDAAHDRHRDEEAEQAADRAGQRRGAARLPDTGRGDRAAPGRRAGQSGGGQVGGGGRMHECIAYLWRGEISWFQGRKRSTLKIGSSLTFV